MTNTGNDAADEATRVDREPPVFPSVSGTPGEPTGAPAKPAAGPLFSRAGGSPQSVAPTAGDQPLLTTAPVVSSTWGSRWRWAIAGVATVAVVALIGAVFVLAGPRAGTPSTVARYAPADTVTYLEARLDLPGDQRDRLAALMSHFPGFADTASFEQKLHDTLNEMLHSSTTDLDWYADIEPWFGGQVGAFSSTVDPTPGTPPSMTIALTVKDRTRLDQLIEQRVSVTNATHEEYQGQTIWTITAGPESQRISFVVTDEVLLAGTRAEEVKVALDVRSDRATGLADDQFFLQQLGGLHPDRLATFYFDGRGVADSLAGHVPSQVASGISGLDWLVNASALRVLGEVRAEADHFALTTRTERPADANLPPLPANRTTTLAEAVPGDSLAYAEIRDVGQTIGFALDQLLAPQPSGSGGLLVQLQGLEQLLGTAPQDFFDFVGDVAISVGLSAEAPWAGLVATVDDEAIASARVDRLLATIRSFATFGGGIEFSELQYGAAKLTVISFGGALQEWGAGTLSVTVTDGRLLIGLGDYVRNALDQTRDGSLAARPQYQAALRAAGSANAGVVFVDIRGLRTALEGLIPPPVLQSYEQDQKPFLAPLSHLAVINTTEGSITVSHVFVYVE